MYSNSYQKYLLQLQLDFTPLGSLEKDVIPVYSLLKTKQKQKYTKKILVSILHAFSEYKNHLIKNEISDVYFSMLNLDVSSLDYEVITIGKRSMSLISVVLKNLILKPKPVFNIHGNELSQLAIYYPFFLHFLFFSNLNSVFTSSFYLKSLKANKIRKRKKLDSSRVDKAQKSDVLSLSLKENTNKGSKVLSYELEDFDSLNSVTNILIKREWRELQSFFGGGHSDQKAFNLMNEKFQSYSLVRNFSNSISFDFFYFLKRNNLMQNLSIQKTNPGLNVTKSLGQFPFYLIFNFKLKKWKEFLKFTSNLQNAILIKDRTTIMELASQVSLESQNDSKYLHVIDKKPKLILHKSVYDFPLFSDILDIRFFEFITNSLHLPLNESQSLLVSFWTNFFSNPLLNFTFHFPVFKSSTGNAQLKKLVKNVIIKS